MRIISWKAPLSVAQLYARAGIWWRFCVASTACLYTLYSRIRASPNPAYDKFLWVDKTRAITMETFWSTTRKATACTEPHEHLRPQHGNGNSLLHKRQITSTFFFWKICPWCCAGFFWCLCLDFCSFKFHYHRESIPDFKQAFLKTNSAQLFSWWWLFFFKLLHGLKYQSVWKSWNHYPLL